MQQPFTRRSFTAAVAALAAGQIARPVAAEAQPEPVPVAPGVELVTGAPEPAPSPPGSRIVIFAVVADHGEADEEGRPKLALMRVDREGTDAWRLWNDADDDSCLNQGLRLDDDLIAAFDRLCLASTSM